MGNYCKQENPLHVLPVDAAAGTPDKLSNTSEGISTSIRCSM
jgi:hypothetical protein